MGTGTSCDLLLKAMPKHLLREDKAFLQATYAKGVHNNDPNILENRHQHHDDNDPHWVARNQS